MYRVTAPHLEILTIINYALIIIIGFRASGALSAQMTARRFAVFCFLVGVLHTYVYNIVHTYRFCGSLLHYAGPTICDMCSCMLRVLERGVLKQ